MANIILSLQMVITSIANLIMLMQLTEPKNLHYGALILKMDLSYNAIKDTSKLKT